MGPVCVALSAALLPSDENHAGIPSALLATRHFTKAVSPVRALIRFAITLMILFWLWTLRGLLAGALLSPIRCAQGVATAVELHQIRKMLLNQRTLNGVYPDDASFASLMAANFSSNFKDPALDSWGQPYYYCRTPEGFILQSGGPDRCLGTSDDLLVRQEEQTA